MSLAEQAQSEMDAAREYFNRSTRNLAEAHSGAAPASGMMTAAQQVAHAAHTIEWFIDGAFGSKGFDTDFAAQAVRVNACTSLTEARAWFERAIAGAKRAVAGRSDAELLAPLPNGPIMGGAPRIAVFRGITDHTAHHRGALTVYARLSGVVPPMPYADM